MLSVRVPTVPFTLRKGGANELAARYIPSVGMERVGIPCSIDSAEFPYIVLKRHK